ncbi:MAG: ABC transporter ATP-binding protein [Desulfatibacillaceae bacterium]|nr:ABC transporter ATP-binding protein [Desulfatibacillaceae bacterium]
MDQKQSSLSFGRAFKNFAPLGPLFRQNAFFLAMGFLSLLVVDGLQLVIPLVIKGAVDSLTLREATSNVLFAYAGWIILLASLMVLFRYIWRLFLLGHARMVEKILRERLFSRVQTLPESYFLKHSTGDLMARFTNDLNAVRMATGMGLAAATDGLLLGAAAVAFMVSINPALTLYTLIPAPFVVVFTRIYTRRMSSGYQRVQKSFGDLTQQVREAYSGIRVIKAYGQEEWTRDKVIARSRHYADENIKLAKSLAVFFPMMMIFTNLGLAIVVGYGGGLAVFGDISPGDFVAFTVYLNLLTWPMMAMGWVTNLIGRGGAAMERISSVLESPAETTSHTPETKKTLITGEIVVRGLSFAYPGQQSAALESLDLKVPAGLFTALTGSVGAGKSTLVSILVRLWEPPAGCVFLDGTDILQLPLDVVRNNILVASQDAVVFSDTVKNNLVFGRKGVDEAKTEQVLSLVRLDEEIKSLKKGLDTLLGERGITLSGGQRQRLALARVLISNPPVLILDDCLSMVDARTERDIMEDILKLRENKTTLAITHRTGALRRADLVLVLDKGTLVQAGTHQELLQVGGIYAKIYSDRLLQEKLNGL